MATNPIVKKAVQAALDEIKEIDVDGWKKLQKDSQELQQVTEDATRAAEEEVNQSSFEEFNQLEKHPPKDLAKIVSQTLSKHLPSSRIEMIENGLQIPTYQLNFRHENDTYFVDITRGGDKFMDSIQLAAVEDIFSATGLQIASIVVEAVLLVLSIFGITVPKKVVAKVAQQVATTIMESRAVKAAVDTLKQIWGSGGSSSSKAKAIWDLIKALWNYRTHGNVFWQIVKGLCVNMTWFEWAKTVAIITATIVAAIATEGVALIAKIALAVNSAVEFGKKVSNLHELEEIKKKLKN